MTNLIIASDGPVRIVSINRPERRNAVDSATALELIDAFNAFDLDDSASVAVLTGEGGAFCAGADRKALAAGASGQRVAPGGIDTPAPMGPSRLRLSKPVNAAIEGYAVAAAWNWRSGAICVHLGGLPRIGSTLGSLVASPSI
jgi:enoyl-CoA hydratase